MEKIKFKDGTLKTPGYVVIDGKTYEIVEAVYEGDTPLSAFMLNKLQDNIEEDQIKATTYEGRFDNVSTATDVNFSTMFPELNYTRVICFNVEITDAYATWDRTYANILTNNNDSKKNGMLQVRSYAQAQAVSVRVTAFYK